MKGPLESERLGLLREQAMSRAQKKALGIVHTPEVLARFAMEQVERALRDELGVDAGLSDPRVCLLDPAVGTGVWLEAALERASHGGTWLGFDVDAQALIAARSVLDGPCRARGITLDLRVRNTLEETNPWPHGESIRVIVGNPPWAARSLSRGSPLSDAALKDFLRDASGAPLNERRVGVLSDDYVRFFRWALAQAESAPRGAVVCFATNSSFLDGPIHRGMRARLLEGFARIEVLDLGGNALIARQGGRDENLFGVRVGAALTLLVRTSERANTPVTVSYWRLSGTREDKLRALTARAREPAIRFVPTPPLVRFVPAKARATEPEGFSLDEAFPFHREGLQTNRDHLTIAVDREELLRRLFAIVRGEVPLAKARHFDPKLARLRLEETLRDPERAITKLAYRPLDTRFVCTVTPLCHRPRPELLRAMACSSWALASVRKDRGEAPFHLFAPLEHVADSCFLSARSSCRTRVFPSHTPEGAENLTQGVAERLGHIAGRAVGVNDVLAYALAVLASESYRARAGEALKHDYPRVPWPRDGAAFSALVTAGQALRASLSELPSLSGLSVKGASAAHIMGLSALGFHPKEGRLTLTQALHIEGVPQRAFEARLGHYPLLATALRAPRAWTVEEVLDVVARTVRWATSLRAADEAFVTHMPL